uniref:Ig-like domain-containing protein n=1 Tax=Paramormyrops kingsleyae TaxID=1676925 RepID=A0A3B3TD25_9TELE
LQWFYSVGPLSKAFSLKLLCPGISGQRIVTQKPSLLTLSKGETATLHCQKPEDDGYRIHWYKQVPGGAPQFVLYYYRTNRSHTYGRAGSLSSFLSVQKVKSSFCTGGYETCSTVVFGQGTKLIVSDPSLEAPSLSLLPPSSEELKTGRATLVCLAKMSAAFADVSWTYNGGPLTDGVFTSSATQQADKTFGLSSFLSVKPSEWDRLHSYSCISVYTSPLTPLPIH